MSKTLLSLCFALILTSLSSLFVSRLLWGHEYKVKLFFSIFIGFPVVVSLFGFFYYASERFVTKYEQKIVHCNEKISFIIKCIFCRAFSLLEYIFRKIELCNEIVTKKIINFGSRPITSGVFLGVSGVVIMTLYAATHGLFFIALEVIQGQKHGASGAFLGFIVLPVLMALGWPWSRWLCDPFPQSFTLLVLCIFLGLLINGCIVGFAIGLFWKVKKQAKLRSTMPSS